jgi:3-hydroxyacyl-[acyl-carrier-protein] dehydratase
LKEPLVSFTDFDPNNVIVDRDGIAAVNPHRHELALLDGILSSTEDSAVGFIDIAPDMFWVRGHFPNRPLMPGVLMCECAAQLSSYFAVSTGMVDKNYVVGLGGLDNIRFRGPVVPGDRLLLMLKRGKVRKNRMFTADFQAYVEQNLVAEGSIRGVALGEE